MRGMIGCTCFCWECDCIEFRGILVNVRQRNLFRGTGSTNQRIYHLADPDGILIGREIRVGAGLSTAFKAVGVQLDTQARFPYSPARIHYFRNCLFIA
jgi:hypothetical protein